MSFKNVIVITGGARGIGASIAKQIANSDTAIILTYNSSKVQAEATLDELKQLGATAIAVQADLKNSAAVKNVIQTAVNTYGKITGVVNNAGVYGSVPIEQVDEDHYSNVFDNNVKSTFLVTAAAAPHLADGASIVNVSSVVTHNPFPNNTIYSASKGALDAFTRALAIELAPRKIRVNTLAPGFTATDMLPDAYKDFAISLTPFKTVGTADDVAEVATFLLSDKSKWVTGQYISASGGISYSY